MSLTQVICILHYVLIFSVRLLFSNNASTVLYSNNAHLCLVVIDCKCSTKRVKTEQSLFCQISNKLHAKQQQQHIDKEN